MQDKKLISVLKSIHKNDSLIGLKRYPKKERTILLAELFNLGYLKFDGMINNKGIEYLNKQNNGAKKNDVANLN